MSNKKKIIDKLNSISGELFRNDVLSFILKLLNIKSKISLNHDSSNFDSTTFSQQMASVGFSKNKNFIININFNDTKFGFVRRLSHEIYHIKQMEDGRLKMLDNGSISFDGVLYTKEEYEKMYHSDEMPKFEEEAFDQERIISNLYWETKK